VVPQAGLEPATGGL